MTQQVKRDISPKALFVKRIVYEKYICHLGEAVATREWIAKIDRLEQSSLA